MEAHGRGFDTPQVAPARTTKFAGIAVDYFAPEAGQWHAEHVIGAWHRRHIADDQQGCATLAWLAQEGEDADVGRVGLYPFKPGGREVQLVECGPTAVHVVKLCHIALQPGMAFQRRHPPFQLAVVGPFASLAEFTAHEEQLLAWMRPHEAEQRAQVGKLLPGKTKFSLKAYISEKVSV